MNKNRGFTLIELVIVVAIIAILAAIALPSYLNQIRKGRRSDVEQAMLQIALSQERFRADCPSYATGFSAACPSVATLVFPANPYSANYYTVAISTTAGTVSTAYTITATAASGQDQDKAFGTSCTPLTYAYANGVVQKYSAGDPTKTDCWSK